MRTLTTLVLALVLLAAAPAQAETRRFWVTNLAVAGATAFDIETTIRNTRHGGQEINPVLRHFASSRAKMYPFEMGIDAAVALWSHHSKSKHRFWPQIALIGAHGVIGTVNLTWGR